VEIWNDVFMQFEKQADGTLVPLAKPNVDTGMGLDRVMAVLHGHKSVYDTELFKSLFQVLEFNQEVMSNAEVSKARVILDHIRASVFIAGDGVEPSNKERGYILRRLLRRAFVFAKLLNLQGHWLEALIGKIVTNYATAYPELVEKSHHIFQVLEQEQTKFAATLDKGLKEFEKLTTKQGTLDGNDAFNLYQTFGFPWELTHELATQMLGKDLDKKEFESGFKKHQELSRTATAGEFKGGLANTSEPVVKLHTATHLMQKALRQVLGDHVFQKGSNITEERTRFDFTHNEKLTDEQKAEVERLVNEWIKRDGVVVKEIMPLEKARELGAIGLFGEKYGETVSVYTISDPNTHEVISREFCGGPHVEHTGTMGHFKILKEEAISAGVRRIKAVLEN
jgi:alanyl-tRNA synthetase